MEAHGDAVTGPFYESLHRIVPSGRYFRTLDRRDEDAPDVVFPEEFLLLVREVPALAAAVLEGGSVVALDGAGAFHHVGDEGGDGFLVGQIAFFFRGQFRHVNLRGVRLPVPCRLEEISERPDEGRFPHQLFLGVGQFHLRGHDAPAFGRDGLVVAHQHESGQLFAGESARQVGGAVFGAQPPVLIRIQRAVPVQVFEGFAFDG